MISDWIFILGSYNHASLKTADNRFKLFISSMSMELRGLFKINKSLQPVFFFIFSPLLSGRVKDVSVNLRHTFDHNQVF